MQKAVNTKQIPPLVVSGVVPSCSIKAELGPPRHECPECVRVRILHEILDATTWKVVHKLLRERLCVFAEVDESVTDKNTIATNVLGLDCRVRVMYGISVLS